MFDHLLYQFLLEPVTVLTECPVHFRLGIIQRPDGVKNTSEPLPDQGLLFLTVHDIRRREPRVPQGQSHGHANRPLPHQFFRSVYTEQIIDFPGMTRQIEADVPSLQFLIKLQKALRGGDIDVAYRSGIHHHGGGIRLDRPLDIRFKIIDIGIENEECIGVP